MFPIRDHNPSGGRPFVTLLLIAVNVAVFLAYWLGLPSEWAVQRFLFDWGLVPQVVTSGRRIETLVTSMFLHGGWMHLIGNMWFLWLFGDNMEDQLGHLRFAGFYLLAGLAAAALQIAADPGSGLPMVGASGAIAGVMGGYLLLFPKARVDVLFIFLIFFRVFPIPAWIVLGFWFGAQLVSGAVTPSDAGGVAYWAHAGGFLGGLVLTLPALIARGGRGYWQRTAGHPAHPAAEYKLSRSAIPRVPRR